MKAKTAILTGSILGFLSVAIGAFAAHGLHLEGYAQGVFETGVRYQFYHALALMGVGTLGVVRPSWISSKIYAIWLAGIILFSGSLYAIALLDEKKWGIVTPIGGVLFLIGWLILTLNILNSKDQL